MISSWEHEELKTLWQSVYVAAIRSGRSEISSISLANGAVIAYKEAFQ